MSIAPLERLTVYGLTSEKKNVLAGLQGLGCVHLLDLRVSGEPSQESPPALAKDEYAALRYLMHSPLQAQPVPDDEDTDAAEIVARAIANRRQLRQVRDRIDELRQQIAEAEPWGDFTLPPPEALAGLRLWFFVVPLREMKAVRQSSTTWQMVNRDHRHAYVVVLAEEEPPQAGLPGRRVDIGPQSLSQLRREEESASRQEQDLLAERWKLTQWIGVLRRDLTRAENRAALDYAAAQTLDAGEVFAISGWSPRARRRDIERFAGELGLACTCEDPAPDDTPPILLTNPEPVAAGEHLVSFFQLPGYRDWDPSGVVFVSFALFFAMIVSDAGYAAVLALGLVALWKRLGKTADGRRWRRLLVWIVALSIGYGVLVGSYFGVVPASGTTLSYLHLLHLNDFDAMMPLTVGVGALHVALANGIVAWKNRTSWTAVASLGWILIIAGGMTLLLFRREQTLNSMGLWLLGTGGMAVLLFSSQRRLTSLPAFMWRIVDGLKAATGLTGAVGDVLSYLRLFALGLASASLAVTFNGLAGQAMELPGIGLLFGLLILLLGHTLNLVLVVIGGVVHGLRLNLIEFYRWSIHDEGRPFRAFRNKETLTWTQ